MIKAKAHADAAPSSASIWINCPASVTQARGRARIPTVYTREGSAAHVVAEHLSHGLLPPDTVEIDGEVVEVDEAMIDAVTVYVDHVYRLIQNADNYSTETKVTVTGLAEPLSGTADFLARTGTLLDVVDLKYGKGVPVSAEDNPQLWIYALGALGIFIGVTAVRMSVVQPRVSGPAVQTQEVAVKDLLNFKRVVLASALERIAKGDPTEIPGEHCRWCVRAGECKTLAKVAQDQARIVFDTAGAIAAGGLDDDALAQILDRAELIMAWIAMVRAEASQRIDHGKTIPGWKLVAKQARRKWIDTDAAETTLSGWFPDLFEDMVKLDTPAAVERVLKRAKRDLNVLKPGEGLVVKESSGTTLAREEDAREGVLTDAKSVFRQLTESLEIEPQGGLNSTSKQLS